MAVGHSQLCVIYHMLKNATRFQDLGADYLENPINLDHQKTTMVSRLEAMGYKVTLETAA